MISKALLRQLNLDGALSYLPQNLHVEQIDPYLGSNFPKRPQHRGSPARLRHPMEGEGAKGAENGDVLPLSLLRRGAFPDLQSCPRLGRTPLPVRPSTPPPSCSHIIDHAPLGTSARAQMHGHSLSWNFPSIVFRRTSMTDRDTHTQKTSGLETRPATLKQLSSARLAAQLAHFRSW